MAIPQRSTRTGSGAGTLLDEGFFFFAMAWSEVGEKREGKEVLSNDEKGVRLELQNLSESGQSI